MRKLTPQSTASVSSQQELANNNHTLATADNDASKSDERCRPDGTNIMEQRRPELYQDSMQQVPLHETSNNIPKTANAAIFATYTRNEQAIEDVCHYIENNLSEIIQLPELFFVADKSLISEAEQRNEIARLSKQLIEKSSAKLQPYQYLCTSLIIDGRHQAVIINQHGLFAKQAQLHYCQRYKWTPLGDGLDIIELPLEQGNIKLVMLTADDAHSPEMVELAAKNHVHLLLAPVDIQQANELEHGLLANAVAHGICVIAASREKNFNTVLAANNTGNKSANNAAEKITAKSTGFIATIRTHFASSTSTRKSSEESHNLPSQPVIKHQHGKITKALIHP